MIVDLTTLEPGAPELSAQDATVVVGAGAAGLALALRLEEFGRAVVLVESGPDPRDTAAVAAAAPLNGGAVVGQRYQGLQKGRQRSLGGATQLWHGQCTRLRSSDLAARPWVPHSGWPLASAELDPWYADAERWFSLSGRGYDRSRWSEHRRLSPLPWSPERLRDDFAEYTAEPHLGDRFRTRLRESPRVTTLVGATATGVRVVDGRVRGLGCAGPLGPRAGHRGRPGRAGGRCDRERPVAVCCRDPEGVGLGRARADRPVPAGPPHRPVARGAPHPSVLAAGPLPRTCSPATPASGPRSGWPPQAQERTAWWPPTRCWCTRSTSPSSTRCAGWPPPFAGAGCPRTPWPTSGWRCGPSPDRPTGWRRWVRGLASAARRPGCAWTSGWSRYPTRRAGSPWTADRPRRARPAAGPKVDWRVSETGAVAPAAPWPAGSAEDLAGHGVGRGARAAGHDRRRGLAGLGHRRLPPRGHHPDVGRPCGTASWTPTSRCTGFTVCMWPAGSVFPIAGYANPTLTIVALALRLADHLSTGPGFPAAA